MRRVNERKYSMRDDASDDAFDAHQQSPVAAPTKTTKIGQARPCREAPNLSMVEPGRSFQPQRRGRTRRCISCHSDRSPWASAPPPKIGRALRSPPKTMTIVRTTICIVICAATMMPVTKERMRKQWLTYENFL